MKSREAYAINIAERLKNKEIWFDLNASVRLSAIKDEYPKGQKWFNNFGSSFYYRSKNLPLTTSGPELVEPIAEYVDLIRTNLSKMGAVILEMENRTK
ncbi:hypothetical protein GSU3472 [Geobacter sulfurreducens PCA]|uniref:Uncharacterized protein n=1 Tax=Geobacter sulfurreducens (strain ATCC 51573 / DSM 12127 / PCA) TaxID=243231 RepID=I7EET1_GEOSL|nr:hypothetical protein GSU3472 [Geobacter sulfurreducens PCA]HCD97220.1 hypothetical protein [Geobacter sulfurreducens]